MPIYLLILPAAAFLGIAYLAVSKKSSPWVRRAAIAALILGLLSIGMCAFFLLSDSGKSGSSRGLYIPGEPVQALKTDSSIFIIMGLIALIFFFLIFLAIRQDRKRKP